MTAAFTAFRERLLRALGLATPRPPVNFDISPLVSVGLLRVATAALAALATAAVARDAIIWVGGLIVVILLLFLPRPAWSPILALLFGLGLLTGSTDPIRTAVVLFATHLLVLLSTLLGRMRWAGRVELRVLLRPLARFGIIQLFGIISLFGLFGL